MNTLRLNTLKNKDFCLIRRQKSGLIHHLLNTLHKSTGGGGSAKTFKDPNYTPVENLR